MYRHYSPDFCPCQGTRQRTVIGLIKQSIIQSALHVDIHTYINGGGLMKAMQPHQASIVMV